MTALEPRRLLASSFIDPPALPQVFLDTTYVPGAGPTINVLPTDNLQTILDNAALGSTIVLPAGVTFSGNYELPNKTSGSGWITIRTSAPDSELPAPGTRITPAHASLLAKISSPNSSYAISTDNSAHHYRFIGIEFTVASNVTSNTGIVVLGSATHTPSQIPNNLIFDRCYIHGNATGNIQNGMRLNSASTAVIDSYFDQCQANASAFESHCIGGYNGPGPYKLVNNTFSSATIPVIFGGALTSNQNIPSDIEIRNNHFTRPESWRTANPNLYVKNLFELKNAQRVLFDGNLLENNWPHLGAAADGSQQKGYAILLTTRGQKDANENELMPQNVVQDVTLTNNVIRKSTVGMSIYGGESSGAKRIKIANNLFEQVNHTWGVNDRTGLFVQFQTVGDTIFDHNTIINDGDILFANGVETADIDFTNNIVNHNAARTSTNNPNYGINGAGTGVGNSTLTGKFVQYTVTKNAFINGNNYSGNYTGTAFGATAAGNTFAGTATTPGVFTSVGFTSLTNRDYRLAASSPFNNFGTDGTDLGANIDTMDAAVAGAVSYGVAGTAAADTWYVKRNGQLIEVYNNATGTGTPILKDMFVYYESLHFNGGDGADTVIVDYSGGNPVPAGGIQLGETGNSSADALQIVGNNTAATYFPADTAIGKFVLGGTTVALRGIDQISASNLSGLTLVGRLQADSFAVDSPAAGQNRVSGTNVAAPAFPPITIASAIPLTIDAATNEAAGGSVDAVTVNAPSLSTFRFIGGSGNDSMTVNGGTLTFSSDLGSDSSALGVTIASGAIVNFASTQRLRLLTVNGTANVPANGGRVIVTKTLVTTSGKLNLNDNAMIVDWTGSSQLTAVESRVIAGRNGGAWNGANGIVTSMSAAMGANALTTLGVAEASQVLNYGAGTSALWEGQTVDLSAVLVGYTFAGDATLNGVIDGDDYFMIDAGFSAAASNYYRGNFNYTGPIDADDYFLIDANYNKAQTAMPAAPAFAGSELPASPEVAIRRRSDDLLDVVT